MSNKIFKIYTGDYSKDGYDSGIDDAKHKAVKNKFKFFKAVNPINYVWNFNNAFESFTTNYNDGYLDGQRVNHEVYTTTKTQGGTMPANNSYEYHLSLIESLKQNLDTLHGYMENITDKYKRQIDAMEGAGFLDNYINPLRNKYAQFEQEMGTLQNMIDRHKAQIALHEDVLQTLINDARD